MGKIYKVILFLFVLRESLSNVEKSKTFKILRRVFQSGKNLVVTVPKKVCEEYGIEKGDYLELEGKKRDDIDG